MPKTSNQRVFASKPKAVTLAAGAKIMQPMATDRKTPTSKTTVKLYNGGYGGSQ